MPSLDHENELRASGHAVVAGVDEAGRGPLAGPVCVAAVILPEGFDHDRLNDSKKLTARQRERIFEEITTCDDILWHCVIVEVEEIDRINILQATHSGMRRAVKALPRKVHAALIDGTPVRAFPCHQRALVGGDGLSFSIAAASVIAKVTRDRIMHDLALQFPGYGFEEHKGYGTPRHMEMIRKLGPCPAHRRSFAPVSQMKLPL